MPEPIQESHIVENIRKENPDLSLTRKGPKEKLGRL